jgi:hypothetical protein
MVNADQYRQLLGSWLWPPLEDVQVQVFPSAADSTRGVVAIVVPAAPQTDRPILVSKTLLDSPRRVELLFGYCERKQARVTHYDVERLHSLLRDGRRLDSELRGRFDALEAKLENRLAAPATPPPEPPSGIDVRIDAAVRAVRPDGAATFSLVAIPPRSLDLSGLFESRANPLVQALDDPPELRPSGFDLNGGGNSRIVGRLRRAYIEGYQLIEAHRDGVVIYIAPGDRGRLCWSREQRQRSHYLINQLALIEMVYVFCLLVDRMYTGQLQTGERILFLLRIHQHRPANQKLLLEPGPLDSFGGLNTREAPSDPLNAEAHGVFGTELAERWAVKILSELYAAFGYEEDRIPYTRVTPQGRVVDPEEIRSVR